MSLYSNVPPGYALVKFHMTDPSGDLHAVNTCGLKLVGTPTAIAVATEIAGMWGTHIMDWVSSEYTFDETTAVVNNGGVYTEGIFLTAVPGASTGEAISPQVAAIIQKLSGNLGRAFRGRFYVPGVRAAALDTNRALLTSGNHTTLQNDANAFLAAIVGGTTFNQLVILHNRHSPIVGFPTQVLSLGAELQVATQRRRNRKAAHR